MEKIDNINISNNDILKATSFLKVDKITIEIKDQIQYKLYDDNLILL